MQTYFLTEQIGVAFHFFSTLIYFEYFEYF